MNQYEETGTVDVASAMNEAFRHGLSLEDMLVNRYGPAFALPDGDDYELDGVISVEFDALPR